MMQHHKSLRKLTIHVQKTKVKGPFIKQYMRVMHRSCVIYILVHININESAVIVNYVLAPMMYRTYLSLVNSGLSPLSLNPSISIKVYNTFVIPKALYGSELWSSMTPVDLRKLEHSHRLSLKYMQGLPRRTPTNFTLSAINAVPLETVINYKKMNFL